MATPPNLDDRQLDALTGATVDLLQVLIRNRCVNDGTADSGEEVRNADVLQQVIEGPGVEVERFEAAPGRVSIVGRIEGSDPNAPSLCLMGHTDVVPVTAAGWREDPFGGEIIDGPDGPEVWGRGAVDMLNITASMAVAFRHLAERGFRPTGDLIYFGVADEEAGSAYGARWMADHHADAIRADNVLTESGGLHSGPSEAPFIGVNVAEKGVAWRRLRVRGTPGHGSAPFRRDNALVKAAAVIQRLHDYRPAPQFHELWRQKVEALELGPRPRARRCSIRSSSTRTGCTPERRCSVTLPRLHPHHLLAERDRRRGVGRRPDEGQRDSRRRRDRRGRPHPAGRGTRRRPGPPARSARRPRRSCRGRTA